jgi:hypothetical protein
LSKDEYLLIRKKVCLHESRNQEGICRNKRSLREEEKSCQIFFTELELNLHPRRFLRRFPLFAAFLIGGSWILKGMPNKVELFSSDSPI